MRRVHTWNFHTLTLTLNGSIHITLSQFDGFPFVIHAFASLTPYVTCILTSRYVTFCGSALIAESSTVLLNLRVMMIKTGRGQGAFFEAIQAAFFLLFIFVRIFVCSFVLFPMWYSELSALWSDRGE